jgi:hypothetical protein
VGAATLATRQLAQQALGVVRRDHAVRAAVDEQDRRPDRGEGEPPRRRIGDVVVDLGRRRGAPGGAGVRRQLLPRAGERVPVRRDEAGVVERLLRVQRGAGRPALRGRAQRLRRGHALEPRRLPVVRRGRGQAHHAGHARA